MDASAKFHADLNPVFVKLAEADFAKHSALPFSSLEDIAAITEALTAELQALKAQENLGDNKLSEIQSRMLKSASRFRREGTILDTVLHRAETFSADLKAGQAEKILKARKDPAFAKVLSGKELNSQQSASQLGLRRVVKVVEARLEELDESIAGLKRRSSNQDSRRRPST